MKNFCYTPVKGIDDVIAEKINSIVEGNNWTPYRVATLRGIYDENESIPLNVDNLDKAADTIMKYRVSLARKNMDKVNKVFSRKTSMSREFAKLHNQLKKSFSSEERFNRISMISTIFSDVVDAIKEEHPELSRDTICKGININGTIIGGQSLIFSRVFDEIMSYYNEALEDNDTEKAEKYKAVIDNWAALTSYARIRLRDTEGLKLGEKLQFVDETNADNYAEYVQSFDIEESKREAWQEENDKHSAFGSISKEVRRLLGSVIKYNEEGEVYDDLDFPIMLDPVSAHQTISDLLVGVTSEKQMLEVLLSESERRNWLTPIVEELKDNNKLRTQFYVDFHKGFQLYSLLGTNKNKSNNGIKHWITKIINRESDTSLKQYLSRVNLGNTIDSTSIFDEKGNVNWSNLKSFKDKINEYLVVDKSSNQFAESKFWGRDSKGKPIISWNERRQIIQELLTAVGIPTDKEIMNGIMNPKNTKNLRAVIRLFEQISTHGIDYISLNKLDAYAEKNKNQSFNKFINITNPKTDYNIKSSIEKILKIIDKQGKGLRYERRARYTDSKGKTTSYDSYVNPSYMSDVFGAISNFVKNNDRLGLQKYIENRFLKSSYFYDSNLQRGSAINPDGILNQWLKELYTSTMDEDGFAANFTFERFLGDDTDNPFENFTSKQHLISVMEMYFSDKQINPASKYAHYPVFILGDSGVAKFIKARKYSSQEILDGMYKVFLQERRRMELAKAANKKLEEGGYSPIANFSGSANRYTILTFLNEEKYSKMIDPNHYEQSVKNAIKAYMAGYSWAVQSNNSYEVSRRGDSRFSALNARFKPGTIIFGHDVSGRTIESVYQNGVKQGNWATDSNAKTGAPRSKEIIKGNTSEDSYREGYLPLWKEWAKQNPSLIEELSIKAAGKTLTDMFVSKNTTVSQARALSEILNERYPSAVSLFKSQASALGVLETKTIKEGGNDKVVYTNLNQNATPETIDKVLADFYWNYKFATINQLQFFTIDPAFYKGTKDLQKRYKEIHAPGTILSLQARDFNGNLYSETGIERCLYFEDIELPATEGFISAIKADEKTRAHVGKYLENTLTDGQGYRTLDSYKKVRGMAGQWTEEHEAAYNAIKSLRAKYGRNEQISNEDLAAIAELAVVFQPIKPYMFTHEHLKVNTSDEVLIPVQHKYAEAVLIPELLPNGLLKDMAYYMEDNDIDMVGSTTIVKVGNFGASIIDYKTNENNLYVDSTGKVIPAIDKDGKELKMTLENQKKNPNFTKLAVPISDKDTFVSQLSKGYVHQLSYEDYRIQTNVPDHLNANQLFGTQLRKLIMANIKMEDSRYSSYIGGQRVNLGNGKPTVLNGRNLVAFYNSLIVANILESYRQFKSQAGDIDNLSDMLIQNIISNSRESMDNMIAYSLNENGEFNIPLFEGELEHDSSATLFSIFKKVVNKQRIKGGSAVQVSALGIKGYEVSGDLEYVIDPNNPNNVLYAECEVPFDLSYTDSKGNVIPLKFEDWCNSDGTLILGDIIEPSSPEYRKYLSYKDDKDNVRKPKIEEKFPGILSFVAYRIPTERDYSMINLQIKRFSPKTAGGTIKVPVQGTTIAGFDFDVDKLYFMMREFVQAKLSDEQIESIWKEIYNRNPEIKRKLSKAREKDNNTQSFINDLFKGFYHSELAQDIAEVPHIKDRLYKYWNDAGLEGSPEELFSQYLDEFGDEYFSFETYNFDESPLENTKTARNNMLIELIQQRLMDPETFSQRYTPGGFAGASKAARFIREMLFGAIEDITENGKVSFEKINTRAKDKSSDPEPNYDATDVMTLITYNQQNQVAGKLIGVFANQNTNHAFASLMKSLTLKTPIAFCGHSYSDLLHAPTGIDVDLNVAEFLAASVDAVKDPVLNFLNLNTLTADAGALLARIGYTTEEIGLLFNQPIIKEVCEYTFNNQTTLEVAMATIVGDYRNIVGNADISSQNKDALLSKESLAKNILNDRVLRERGEEAKSKPSFASGQLIVAELFNGIIQASSDITRFVTSSKFTASNAVGSTFGDLYAQQMKVAKYLDDANKSKLSFNAEVTETIKTTISNDESQLSMSDKDYIMALLYDPFGYEQAMYDMNRRVEKVLSKYFPYNTSTYKDVRGLMASLTKGGTLDADTINSIHRDVLAYMLSQREGSLFNGEQPVRIGSEVISAREYYTNRFAKRLYETIIANPELKSFMILNDQFAEFITDEDTGAVSLQITNVGSLQPYQKEAIKESWEQLAEEYPNIARDLFIYNFYKTGFNFSPFAFMNLAPNSIKQLIKIGNGISYIDFLREVQAGDVRIDTNNFAKQYILNHLTNYKLVFYPKGDALTTVKKLYRRGDVVSNSFDLDIAKLSEDEQKIWTMGKNEFKELKFRPCIIIEGTPYIADGDGARFNTSTSTSITYRRASAQGSTNKSLMFLSSTEKSKDLGIIEDMAFEGSTSIEPEVSPFEPFDRSVIISEVAKEFKAAYDAANLRDEAGELYSINAFTALLEAQSDEVLLQQVEVIKKACRQNGILVLDSDGNLMQNC